MFNDRPRAPLYIPSLQLTLTQGSEDVLFPDLQFRSEGGSRNGNCLSGALLATEKTIPGRKRGK